MSRRFMLLTCAAVAATAVPFLSVTPADAHHRMHYNACVVADYDTWLRRHRCDYRCRRWVGDGRAFRVVEDDGPWVRVWNLSMDGWIKIRALRLVRQAYCRAAGI